MRGGRPTAVTNNPFNYNSNKFLSRDDQPLLILNLAAFTQVPLGQFSTGTLFYSDYRWQWQPIEN